MVYRVTASLDNGQRIVGRVDAESFTDLSAKVAAATPQGRKITGMSYKSLEGKSSLKVLDARKPRTAPKAPAATPNKPAPARR